VCFNYLERARDLQKRIKGSALVPTFEGLPQYLTLSHTQTKRRRFMATRKSAAGKGAKKGGAKASAAATRPGALPPYGEAIRDAAARGDQAEMRRVAASARKYLRDVQAALDKLDKALGK
jgi:Domain of unknown function (DUF1843)